MSVPDEGYSRNVPDEGYSRNVPDEGYSRNVPDEGYSRSASSALNLISMSLLFVIYIGQILYDTRNDICNDGLCDEGINKNNVT